MGTTLFRRVRAGALGVGLLGATLLGGCQPERDGGAARFAASMAGPCPIFRDQLLSPERPAVACPVPVASADPQLRPCAIAHYLGYGNTPRTVRRLAYDARGRVERWSDHDGERVVEARIITYEADGEGLAVHDFATRCDEPTPLFLFSQHYGYDDTGRLGTWRNDAQALTLHYTLQPDAFGGRATVRIENGSNAPDRWLSLDRHGNVSARGRGAPGDEVVSSSRVRYRGGLAAEVRRAGPQGHFRGETRYSRDEHGRVTEIAIRAPGHPPQRFVLRYDCDGTPTCAPGRHPRGASPHTPTAVEFDPELSHLQPRDCEEQLRLGPQICAPLPRGRGGLLAQCCKGQAGQLRLSALSPMARRGVARMVLVTADGGRVESAACRGGDALGPSQCDFAREELRALSGPGQFEARDADGLLIDRGPADLDQLARVAR